MSHQQKQSPGSKRVRASITNSPLMAAGITPQWLLKMLPWLEIKAEVYRVLCQKIALPDIPKMQLPVKELNNDIKDHHLKELPFFQGLEPTIIDELAQQFTLEEYDANQYIIREGEKGDKFYILLKGEAEAYKTESHINRVHLAVYEAGDVFGEIALLKGIQRIATIKTLTDCQVLSLNADSFAEMVERVPLIKENTLEMMNRRIALKEEGHRSGEESNHLEEKKDLTETSVEYKGEPREYPLNIIRRVLHINTQVTHGRQEPHKALNQQLRLTVEAMKERQEWEIINNSQYGLLNQIAPSQQIQTRFGPPSPDDLDELISKVWKEPAFFLAHPKAIAAFGRECTRCGISPVTVKLHGSSFMTWRGIPLVPCDKLLINGTTHTEQLYGTTNLLLLRVGEERQGVIGLLQTGIENEESPGLSVRCMGVDARSTASYLVTMYFNTVVLTADAIGVLKDVKISSGCEQE